MPLSLRAVLSALLTTRHDPAARSPREPRPGSGGLSEADVRRQLYGDRLPVHPWR